jgi:sortase A
VSGGNRWRWLFAAVYRFGVILIALGVLVFGFAGWQLWGTGLETAAAQNRLEDDFAALSESLAAGTVPDSTVDTVPAGTAPSETTVLSPDTATPPDTTPADTTADTTTTSTAAPVPVTSIVTTQQAVVVPSRPTSASNWFKVSQGEVVARIEIPALAVDDFVVAGVRKEDLKLGPGHHPGTVLPGQIGNSLVAGHRTTYGAVFGNLDRLAAGDEIIVTLPTGDRYVYQVTVSEIIDPSDISAAVVPTADAQLTLLTCTPKYTAQSRLIVHSTLVASESSVLWDGPPDPLTQYVDVSSVVVVDDGVVDDYDPADPVELVPVEVIDSVTGETITVDVPSDVSPEDVTVADGEVTIPSSPDEAAASASLVDGFEDGWFADRTAYKPFAEWGALCALIAFAAWALVSRPLEKVADRRTRRRLGRFLANTAGLIVGIAPFLFCLYFMYEAISRMLPGSV